MAEVQKMEVDEAAGSKIKNRFEVTFIFLN